MLTRVLQFAEIEKLRQDILPQCAGCTYSFENPVKIWALVQLPLDCGARAAAQEGAVCLATLDLNGNLIAGAGMVRQKQPLCSYGSRHNRFRRIPPARKQVRASGRQISSSQHEQNFRLTIIYCLYKI